MKTELETRPYLVVWNDHTRDMLIRASQIDRPDADETCLVFWRGCDEVLIAPIDNVHHVRPLSDVEAKAHEEEQAACVEAHALMHDLVKVLRDNAAKSSDDIAVGLTEDGPETPEQSAAIVDANLRGMGSAGLTPKADACDFCPGDANNGVSIHRDYCPLSLAVDTGLTGAPAA